MGPSVATTSGRRKSWSGVVAHRSSCGGDERGKDPLEGGRRGLLALRVALQADDEARAGRLEALDERAGRALGPGGRHETGREIAGQDALVVVGVDDERLRPGLEQVTEAGARHHIDRV